jgi:hypothetical protein
VIEELARVTGRNILSDGYLSRRASRPRLPLGPTEVLAPAGISLSSALDRVCERYEYLWWERDGCVYLRARAWPWDGLYEVPDDFLDAWAGALDRGGALSHAALTALTRLTPLQLNGLAALERQPREFIFRADTPAARQFRKFFQSLPGERQARLLGSGVLVTRDEVAPLRALLFPLGKEFSPRPFLLRLAQGVEEIPQATPRRTRVTLKLDAPREAVHGQAFAVEIPRFPDPFAP